MAIHKRIKDGLVYAAISGGVIGLSVLMFVLIEGEEVTSTECWEGGSFEYSGITWWTWDEGCGESSDTVYSWWDETLANCGCLFCCSGLIMVLASSWKLVSGVFVILIGKNESVQLVTVEEHPVGMKDEFEDLERDLEDLLD